MSTITVVSDTKSEETVAEATLILAIVGANGGRRRVELRGEETTVADLLKAALTHVSGENLVITQLRNGDAATVGMGAQVQANDTVVVAQKQSNG